jgi:hypothetical protein
LVVVCIHHLILKSQPQVIIDLSICQVPVPLEMSGLWKGERGTIGIQGRTPIQQGRKCGPASGRLPVDARGRRPRVGSDICTYTGETTFRRI